MNRKIPKLLICIVVMAFCYTACQPMAKIPVEPEKKAAMPSLPTATLKIIPTLRIEQKPLIATGIPEELPPPQHEMYPAEYSGKEQIIHDQITEDYASQKRAAGGDDFDQGQFERPFDRQMRYLGNIDIVKSTMVRADEDFIFVTIEVAKPVASAINDPAYYGLELDLNRDGRSLFMIRGLGPLTDTWMTEGVDVWKSTSAAQPASMAVGAIPVTGALGFDVNLLRSGRGSDNDLAWMRLKPGSDNVVEIAFKNNIVGGKDGKFIWRPFTDAAPYSEREYDLHVSYTLEQAGSPYSGENYYPLKDVFAVDNTCRAGSGYDVTGNETGICPLPPAD